MEKFYITKWSQWYRALSLVFFVAGLAGLNTAQGQCLNPSGLATSGIGDTGATLNWTSNNGPVTDHCWNIEVGGVGFSVGNGQAVVATTICEGDAGLSVSGSNLSYAVSGLQPGTSYIWCVTETCDGMAMPFNASGWVCSQAFKTLDDPFVVTSSTTSPSCPSVSPGYVTDGSISLTIADGSSCPAGSYTITQTGGPTTLIPTGYVGVSDGTYDFDNAGAGTYTFSVTELGNCNPPNPTISVSVNVAEGTDTEDPTWYIVDMLFNVVADNDPFTPQGSAVNLGTVTIPEGSCSYQQKLMAYGFDNCDGFISAVNAVTASAVTTPSTINPGTQVGVTADGFGFYGLDINWSTGSTTLTATMCDAIGNCPSLSLTAFVDDNINPSVTIVGANNITIPACAATRDVQVTIYIDDLCDQDVSAPTVDFGGNPYSGPFDGGDYFEYTVTVGPEDDLQIWSASYVDDFGNPGFADVQISVAQAAEDMPAVIIAADENVLAPVCAGDTYVTYSFQILDDCSDINVADIVFDDGGAGLASSWVDVDDNNNSAYLGFEGIVAPGAYFMVISYQGTQVEPLLVVQPQADQDPVIVLPGNLNFTIPVCQPDLTTTFSITISDDCDDPIGSASFSLGGAPITPSFTNADAGYFEFTETLSPANDGDLLVASYTDGGGNTTTVNGLITITDQPDNWAPIIVYPSQDINLDLDPCGPPTGMVTFQVTATDNCDGLVMPTVTVNGDMVPFGSGTLMLSLSADTYQVVIEATDAAGNTRTEDFFINVTQAPRPQDYLACNDNIIVTLNSECEATIIPDMVLEGEFGCLVDENFEIVVVDGDISNGGVVDGPGTYNYEITKVAPEPISGFAGPFAADQWQDLNFSTDGTIDFSSDGSSLTITGDNSGDFLCLFFGAQTALAVTIPEDGNLTFDWAVDNQDAFGPGFDFFVAQIGLTGTVTSLVQQTADGSGSVDLDLVAGDVLAVGVISDCNDGTVVSTIDNFVFAGADPLGDANFTTCWGTLTAEDKTNPTIECPDDTDQIINLDPVAVTSFSGELDGSEPTFSRPNNGSTAGNCSTAFASSYPYDSYTFTVSETDEYTFVLDGAFDGFAAIYDGSFNPADACQNIIEADDDDGPGLNPQLIITLTMDPGVYVLVTSTFSSAGATGAYTWSVSSAGGAPITIAGLAFDLICDDINEVLNNAASFDLVGAPVTDDNCTDPTPFTFTDTVVEDGDCGDVVIIRTFVTEDATGRTATCSQEITFRKPTLDDVGLPPPAVALDCDASYPVNANGNPSPAATGAPIVTTAFGAFDLSGGTYCNLAADYVDGNTINVCEGTDKFVRTWTILDWCNPGNVTTYTQIIKVGDASGPVLDCPTADYDWDGENDLLTYSTGPFNCTAAFQAPMPGVSDACSANVSVLTEIVTDIEVDDTNQYGQVIGSHTETIVVATIEDGASRFISGIPTGQHRFRYTATDDCGNESSIECAFQVVDTVEPNAVCDDDLNISIGGQGYARVYAEDIDEGSNDNCGPVRIEVRRLVTQDANCNPITPFYTPWGPFVEFSCCDVDEMVTIELRVWDDANANGVFGGWYGDGPDADDNSNVCWLEVLVEDKIRPYCVAPHNATIDCDDLPYDFDPFNLDQLQALFGVASATDNCNADWEELTPIVNLDDCGFGTIIRRFRATDDSGNVSTNSCQQLITVNEVHNYEIKFPRDAEANCGTPVVDTIEYNELGCDLLAVSVDDEPFSASGEECYKIFRTYRVINWCEYNGIDEPVVVSRDEDCDGNPGDEAVWVLVRPHGVTYFDRNNNENNDNPSPFTKGTSCDGLTNPKGHWINSTFDGNATRDPITGAMDMLNPGEGDPSDKIRDIASRGYWEYTQHIKVYDNIDPVITVGAFDDFCSLDNVDCDGPVDIPFSVDENCAPDDVEVKQVFLDAFFDGSFAADLTLADGAYSVTGAYPNYNIVSAGLPIGDHAFEVHVKDGCGNVDALLIPFSVVDCKAPTPICINGLAIELMPVEPGVDADGDGDEDRGAMMICATDFIASPISDCTDPITYSINRSGETVIATQNCIVLTCGGIDDVDPVDSDLGTVIVEIHAWDGAGNNDFCETYVLVEDNMFDLCIGDATISGGIETELGNGVEDVGVDLSGNMTGTVQTKSDGAYIFNNLEPGYDYTVTPVLDVDHFNGVSTFDLVLISKHILGAQPLNSPYKMIAADVNNSGSITTLDLIQARKGVLGLIDDYPNNTSWRFVAADYDFADPTDPWFEEFPEVVNYNDIPAEVLITNFIAIKIGDVNGNAQYSSLMGAEERNMAGVFTIEVAEQALRTGEVYTVDFTAADLSAVQGYQFTLHLDAAKANLVDIVYGAAGEDNFGMRFVDEGVITTSWHRASEASAKAPTEEVLFSLVVRANDEAQLSEVLSVSSRYTVAEAYNASSELLDVALNFGQGTVSGAGFALYQNTPNPFKGETLIGFELPEAAQATLKIHDVTGRVLQLVRIDGVQGYNQVTVNSSELSGVGVMYYTLETADYTATKKMIIIE